MAGNKRALTYSEYINDHAIIEALRIPQPPPQGVSIDEWPLWHPPSRKGRNGSAEWRPGQAWPRGDNWSHHEVLFIRTHQAFEVWFAVVIHELSSILTEAQERCDLEGRTIPRVELSARAGLGRGFSPKRFPRLERLASSFSKDFLRNRVFYVQTPGRHSLPRESLEFPPEILLRWTRTLERAAAALHVTIPFFDVLSSLSSGQFLEFRGRLSPASGFGSAQFREIEMMLGLRELSRHRVAPTGGTAEAEDGAPPLPAGMLRPTEATPPHERNTCFWQHHLPGDWDRLAARFRGPSLRDLVYGLLNANIFDWGSQRERDERFDEFAALNLERALSAFDLEPRVDENRVSDLIDGIGEVLSHHETIVAALLAMERLQQEQVALHSFLDACMKLDAALLRWRDQHIRFVEGMIGWRPGTGGAGVNYLRSTTDPSLATFLTHGMPCLWQARTLVQRDG